MWKRFSENAIIKLIVPPNAADAANTLLVLNTSGKFRMAYVRAPTINPMVTIILSKLFQSLLD